MNKKMSILIVLIIVIILIILSFMWRTNIKEIIEKVQIQNYGEPISENGEINNAYFKINSEGKNAKETTKGINNAIEYANIHNIKYIKLSKGTYLINGVGKYTEKKGIILKSNITLDFNGSTIKHETVSDPRYSVITIFEEENVKIVNGIVEGDKTEHDYDSIKSTHEYGYGIELRGAKNVEISNLSIKDLTGDGILISEMEEGFSIYKKDNISEDININNCNIYENRRQGISVIDAENVKISENEIHDISGTKPAAAIDLEPNLKTEEVRKIKISKNKFYNLQNIYAIKTEGGTYDVDIIKNEINGGLLISSMEEIVKIYQNAIINGKIDIALTYYNKNRGYNLNKVEVKDNIIKKADISILKVKNALFESNEISNSDIISKDANLILYNNIFKENINKKFKYLISDELEDSYRLFICENTQFESYKTEIPDDNRIKKSSDLEEMNKYIKENL